MISLHRIARLASNASLDPSSAALLLDEILGSSRPLPLGARLRLEAPETLATVSIALGLSRFTDLTFTPSPDSASLVDRLLAHQREEGSFGSLCATAVASAALLKASEQFGRAPGGAISELAQRCEISADRALAWLSEQLTPASGARWQSVGSLLDEDDADEFVWEHDAGVGSADSLDLAIALWQLAGLSSTRARSIADALLQSLDQSGARHDRAVAQLLDRASCALSGSTASASPAIPTQPSVFTEAA
ncbi:MAG: hypothetical protein NXI14_02330 [bacterium]|nr:hypothetical protein [bacterium]